VGHGHGTIGVRNANKMRRKNVHKGPRERRTGMREVM
jgi:hypothetical protein